MKLERFLWLALSVSFAVAAYLLEPESAVAPTILYICAGVYLHAATFGNPVNRKEA